MVRRWHADPFGFWLGWPAFSAVLAIFYLMVFKSF
jgi:uncharacterized membrane protein